jgi:sporulation protein YlmC with PRC-barrel domain
MSYGEPQSYLTLAKGTDVISSDGERVGVVELVLSDQKLEVFDGVVIDTESGPGGLHFVDGPEVGEIYENAVIIKVAAADVAALPKPAENPAVMEHHADEGMPGALSMKLRRAWDFLSGNR